MKQHLVALKRALKTIKRSRFNSKRLRSIIAFIVVFTTTYYSGSVVKTKF